LAEVLQMSMLSIDSLFSHFYVLPGETQPPPQKIAPFGLCYVNGVSKFNLLLNDFLFNIADFLLTLHLLVSIMPSVL